MTIFRGVCPVHGPVEVFATEPRNVSFCGEVGVKRKGLRRRKAFTVCREELRIYAEGSR